MGTVKGRGKERGIRGKAGKKGRVVHVTVKKTENRGLSSSFDLLLSFRYRGFVALYISRSLLLKQGWR